MMLHRIKQKDPQTPGPSELPLTLMRVPSPPPKRIDDHDVPSEYLTNSPGKYAGEYDYIGFQDAAAAAGIDDCYLQPDQDDSLPGDRDDTPAAVDDAPDGTDNSDLEHDTDQSLPEDHEMSAPNASEVGETGDSDLQPDKDESDSNST